MKQESAHSMKAFEFDSRLAKSGIQVPGDLVSQIPDGTEVRVILLLRSTEDDLWRQNSMDGFAAAYADEDSVYESLIDESQTG
jgi:hypothetical protein